jgi:tenascin
MCECDAMYSGLNCENEMCPNLCSGHGICEDNHCSCNDGYTGEDCSVKLCLNDCSGNGECVNGVCTCEELYTGDGEIILWYSSFVSTF